MLRTFTITFFLSSFFDVVSAGEARFNSDWGRFELCSRGRQQSPINIISDSAQFNTDKANVKFYWERRKNVFNVTYRNDGTKLFTKENTGFTEGLEVGGVFYRVDQLIFHWGYAGEVGSQHQIDGSSFDGEVEIVHIRDPIENYTQAFEEPGDAIVVSAFLKIDETIEKDNYEMKMLRWTVGAVKKGDGGMKLIFKNYKFSLETFLPWNQHFFRYSGSSTLTGCEEGVERIVFKDPICVSKSVIETLAKLKKKNQKPLLGTVKKALHSMNGRELYRSWQP